MGRHGLLCQGSAVAEGVTPCSSSHGGGLRTDFPAIDLPLTETPERRAQGRATTFGTLLASAVSPMAECCVEYPIASGDDGRIFPMRHLLECTPTAFNVMPKPDTAGKGVARCGHDDLRILRPPVCFGIGTC